MFLGSADRTPLICCYGDRHRCKHSLLSYISFKDERGPEQIHQIELNTLFCFQGENKTKFQKLKGRLYK